jgi:hypothetical protein
MNEEEARRTAWKILGEVEEMMSGRGVAILTPSEGDRRREKASFLDGEYHELDDAIVGILMAESSDTDERAIADSEARRSCEQMPAKAAKTPAGWVQHRQAEDEHGPDIDSETETSDGDMNSGARDVDWDFLYECWRDAARLT